MMGAVSQIQNPNTYCTLLKGVVVCLILKSRGCAKFDFEIKGLFFYRKIATSNTSRLNAHAGFFRLLMKRIFDPYIL